MIRLRRIAMTDDVSLGVLIGEAGLPLALTLERPWRNNAPEVSCIPPGSYTARRVTSPKFGETFEVTGVPGRSHILMHKGNTPADTEGCILVGAQWGTIAGCPAVLDEQPGLRCVHDSDEGQTGVSAPDRKPVRRCI